MRCVLIDGFVAFMRGLRVLHVFRTDTGGMLQQPLPLTELAGGQELPTSHGWRLINQARSKPKAELAKSHRRPRKRH